MACQLVILYFAMSADQSAAIIGRGTLNLLCIYVPHRNLLSYLVISLALWLFLGPLCFVQPSHHRHSVDFVRFVYRGITAIPLRRLIVLYTISRLHTEARGSYSSIGVNSTATLGNYNTLWVESGLPD